MAEVLKTNNMPKFKENPSTAMKKSVYKMAYQGNTSAFPFKSPMKDVKKSKIYNEEHQNEFDHVGKFNDKHVPKKK